MFADRLLTRLRRVQVRPHPVDCALSGPVGRAAGWVLLMQASVKLWPNRKGE
jgi:hypothetical protein